MKLSQLRSFLSVAEHGSIRAAARALGMSQPAVTQAMRELELSVDAPLLQRGTAGVELTVYGRSLVRRASVIQREMERAVAEIEEIRDGSSGLISIAISTAVAGMMYESLALLWLLMRPCLLLLPVWQCLHGSS